MLRRVAVSMWVLLASAPALAAEATLLRDPSCGCCAEYGRYLGMNGYDVTVIDDAERLASVKSDHGVPEVLHGCHTVLLDGYVIEGHVPVEVIDRLLAERPEIEGISLPGMPPGSPGMGGRKEAPFEVFAFSDDGGAPAIYATE